MKAYLEPSDIVLLEKAATFTRDRLLIRVIFRTGCRVSEAIALTVDDVDLEHGRITIEHLKVRISALCPDCGARLAKADTYCSGCSEKIEKVVKKAKEHRRVRTLPVDEETIELIDYHIKQGGPVLKKGKLMIFGFRRTRAWQILNSCGKKAGLGELVNPETGKKRGISPHRLRDAFAVNAIKHDDSGDGLRLLQEQLGHQSFNTTARYRKVAGEELREWYGKLWREEKESG